MKFIKTKTFKVVRNVLFIISLAAVSFFVHKSVEGDNFKITLPEMLSLINTVFIANLMVFNRWK